MASRPLRSGLLVLALLLGLAASGCQFLDQQVRIVQAGHTRKVRSAKCRVPRPEQKARCPLQDYPRTPLRAVVKDPKARFTVTFPRAHTVQRVLIAHVNGRQRVLNPGRTEKRCKHRECLKKIKVPDKTVPVIPPEADTLRILLYDDEHHVRGLDLALH